MRFSIVLSLVSEHNERAQFYFVLAQASFIFGTKVRQLYFVFLAS